jgi:glycerophosphoryl diester phosphodiesterase
MPTIADIVAVPIAHRGFHDRGAGCIENTLPAAEAALERDFGIECDVQLSADGEAMVFHDFELERLAHAAGAISARSAVELAEIAMRGSDARIPTLAQLLDLVAGRLPLIVEVKSRFDGDMRLTRRVVELCGSYRGPLGIKSFDVRVVCELRRSAPKIARGIVAMADYSYPDYATISAAEKRSLANLLHFKESRPDFVSWRVTDLPSAAPFFCREILGMPLMSWTVRGPADKALALAHADQIVFEGFDPRLQS